ncbi:MAG: Fis family transcriptional regulator [Acidobacteria bacterium]|nr:MAG: Fis family transcriptional regulator [Acidobacteriota bacterium]
MSNRKRNEPFKESKGPSPNCSSIEEQFENLAQAFRTMPVGLISFDRDLRFLCANEQVPAFLGVPIEDLIGKTVREAIPGMAAFFERTYRPVFEDGNLALQVEVHGSDLGHSDPEACWLVSRLPVHGADGTVIGANTVVQDISELAQKRKAMEARLDFEQMVAEISGTMAGLRADAIDGALSQALGQLGLFVGAGRALISEVTEQSQFRITHSWSATGIEAMLVGSVWAAMAPGILKTLLNGKTFCVSRPEEIAALPDEDFAVDKRSLREAGTTAHLSIPIKIGGQVIGVLSFGVLSGPHLWPSPIVDRLKVLAEVFGNAFTRRDSERKLRSTLIEVEALKNRLLAETCYLEKEAAETGDYEELVGSSKAIRHVLHEVEQVAPTDASILILGETGTGKELIARTLHRMSSRSDRPMVRVNCATLPATLIESELFGHERGAFTGAVKRKVGRFEVADGGTIFLDEIGDLPLDLQSKLLRVLQEGEFERLGSTATITVDVRVIAATNRNLIEAIDEGSFRADLYYRLHVVPIEMPPLRDRRDDIPLLVWHFVRRHQLRMHKTIRRIPNDITKAMLHYDWPGNVRELANVVERAVILTRGDTLMVDESFTRGLLPAPLEPKPQDLRGVEREHIIEVLERCGWKVKGRDNAAERLGLNPSTLRARMKKLGIERP